MNWFDEAIDSIIKAFGGYKETAKLLWESIEKEEKKE